MTIERDEGCTYIKGIFECGRRIKQAAGSLQNMSNLFYAVGNDKVSEALEEEALELLAVEKLLMNTFHEETKREGDAQKKNLGEILSAIANRGEEL